MSNKCRFVITICIQYINNFQLMDSKEILYYGFGQVVYSLALQDGKVQKEEFNSLSEIVKKAQNLNIIELDITSIIFQLHKSESVFSAEESFELGLKNMNLGDNHLTKSRLESFVVILESIASAFPPKTQDESSLIERFKLHFNNIK